MWQFYRPERNLVIRDFTFLVEVDEPEKIKIDREHSEFTWINLSDISEYETFDNIEENLHQLGATKSAKPFRVLYTNYKGETKWRNIIPKNYFYGETEYHKGKRWLLECFDTDKNDMRTYAVEDTSIFTPPIYE